jgi:hypothetical protein
MPLPKPEERELIQSRDIILRGYKRKDGLWDIEAHMKDVKTHDFPDEDRGGFIRAGETFHGIAIRITIDDDMVIKDACSSIDFAPFKICNQAEDYIKRIIGTKIKAGFKKHIFEIMPWVEGCTHVRDLLTVAAGVAYQTLWPVRNSLKKPNQKPNLLNSCHAWDSNRETIKKYYPDYYTGETNDKN